MSSDVPFKVGTTSFILADDYGPNIEFLADKVDDIALLFFESLPSSATLPWLPDALAARQHTGVSFSIHLPTDIRLASTNASTRINGVRACASIIEKLSPLTPGAYVCHADGDAGGALTLTEQLALTRSLKDLGELAGDPALICVENVALPHASLRSALDESGVSICYDTGHALLAGQPVLDELSEWLPRCRVMHLHGIRENRDHHTLDTLPEGLLADILRVFSREQAQPDRILTLELFNRTRWESSRQTLASCWAQLSQTHICP